MHTYIHAFIHVRMHTYIYIYGLPTISAIVFLHTQQYSEFDIPLPAFLSPSTLFLHSRGEKEREARTGSEGNEQRRHEAFYPWPSLLPFCLYVNKRIQGDREARKEEWKDSCLPVSFYYPWPSLLPFFLFVNKRI